MKESTTSCNFFFNAKICFLIILITIFIIFYLPVVDLQFLPTFTLANSILAIKIYSEKLHLIP